VYICVVKKGPFHFFADKHEDVVATGNKWFIHEFANKTKVDIRSTSDDVVEKNFEILHMLLRGIESVYSAPQTKPVSNYDDFLIFIYPEQLILSRTIDFHCLQSGGIDLERVRSIQRDRGYGSDDEHRKKARKRTQCVQDTRDSSEAVQNFRRFAERHHAQEIRQASVEVERNDMDERDLDDIRNFV